MPITDAQVHFWDIDRPERPWPRPLQRPQQPNGFYPSQMIPEMDAAGVDRAVIVPPTWAGDYNDLAIQAAQDYPGRFAVMGRFDPRRPDAQEALASWRSQPHMLGIRMTFRVPPYDTWLDDGTLDRLGFWDACEQHGIPVMVLVPNEAHKLQPVAQRHPNLTLLIDHMAADLEGKGADAFKGLNAVIDLARYPNVSVKTSSAPCFSAEPYPFRDIYPFLRRIYDAYGARRMLWGADFTRLTSTYPECLRHFQEGLDFLTEEDKEWVLGKSAATILNWPEK